MKLTQIVPSLEPQYGGPSRSVLALSAALARDGHDVDLLATVPGAGESHSVGSLRVRNFHRNWPHRLCPSSELRAALQTGGPAVIHHHALWLRTLHYAHRAALGQGAKLVLSPRGMMSRWAWRHRDWKKKLARALVHPGALEAVHGWHATSVEEEAEIRALGFQQPVCVAPNGVDAPAPAEVEFAAHYWRQACPAVTRRPVALFYSRFHEKKRIIELIDAWLEHAPRDWLLLLVGIPQTYTAAMLDAYVMRQSGAGRVQAFEGTRCPPPYAVSSLFLLPSHNENFGLVVAEAMAHGVPALVTDSTPWRSINAADHGWCVPWSDYPAALRVATALGTSALRERGYRAQEWVLREYSWATSARLLAAFYERLHSGPA
jgi:glycosyltransferase involved in cell wall biosynthesis